AAAIGLRRRCGFHEHLDGARSMPDPDLAAERPARALWRLPRYERDALQGNDVRLEIGAPGDLDRVRERVDAADVARLAEGDAEALPLADRVAGRAAMRADDRAVTVHDRSRFWLPARALA